MKYMSALFGTMLRLLKREKHDFSLHSGERQTAENLAGIWQDHINRYRFASSFLQDYFTKIHPAKSLHGADIFCGNGYGTYILGSALPHATILAIDGSREAINFAKRHYFLENINFKSKKFPFDLKQNYFDFIVSLESIEHIKNDIFFFRKLTSFLKSQGILILSTPNEGRLPLERNNIPFHFKHYNRDELLKLSMAYDLKILETYGQDTFVLNGEGNIKEFQLSKNMNLQKDYDGQYLILVFQK